MPFLSRFFQLTRSKTLVSALHRSIASLVFRPSMDGPNSLVNFERVMRGTRSLAR